MRYYELLSEDSQYLADMNAFIVDHLVALQAQGVPEVSMIQVLAGLRRRGYEIDKESLMDMLNPDEVGAVDQIVGDTIYLAGEGEAPDRSIGQKQTDKEGEKIKKMAQKTIDKDMKDGGPL